MKKVLIIFYLIFFCNISYGACNYEYTTPEVNNSNTISCKFSLDI